VSRSPSTPRSNRSRSRCATTLSRLRAAKDHRRTSSRPRPSTARWSTAGLPQDAGQFFDDVPYTFDSSSDRDRKAGTVRAGVSRRRCRSCDRYPAGTRFMGAVEPGAPAESSTKRGDSRTAIIVPEHGLLDHGNRGAAHPALSHAWSARWPRPAVRLNLGTHRDAWARARNSSPSRA